MAKKKEGLTSRQRDYICLMMLPIREQAKRLIVENTTAKTMNRIICKKYNTKYRGIAVLRALGRNDITLTDLLGEEDYGN